MQNNLQGITVRVHAKVGGLGVKFGHAGLRSANAILLRDSLSPGEAFSPGTPRPRTFLLTLRLPRPRRIPAARRFVPRFQATPSQ
jgi:hypothetical protein